MNSFFRCCLMSILISVVPGMVQAQFVFQKTFGGPLDETFLSVRQTSDTGFVASGSTFSFATGERDFYIVKTNAVGNKIWERTSGMNNIRDISRNIIQTADGGYLATGILLEPAGDQMMFQKYDATGTQQWLRSNGGTFDDECNRAIEIPGIGFAYVGMSDNYGNSTPNQAFFLMDNSGGIIASRHIGGAGIDAAWDVERTSDGGFVTGGFSENISGLTGRNMTLVKLSILNAVTFERSIGGSGNEEAFSVKQTTDGGYILCGYTNSFGAGNDDIFVVKCTAGGGVSWARTIGGAANDRGAYIRQTSDGGYIIAGFTNSYGFGGQDGILVKLNSSGNFQWAKAYGGPGFDSFDFIDLRRANSGFVMSGSTASFGAGGLDGWIVATDNNGYSGGCNEMFITPQVNNANPNSLAGMSNWTGSTPAGYTYTTTAPNSTINCLCTDELTPNSIQGITQVCRNNTPTPYFINRVRGAVSYSWTATNATIAPPTNDTLVNISFTGTTSRIIVTANFGGCSSVNIDTIDVTINPVNVNVTGPGVSCSGDPITINAIGSGGTGALTYAWNPGALTGSSIAVNPTSTTTYVVTATDAIGCTDQDSITVTVNPYPTVNLGNDTVFCAFPTFILDAQNAGATYLWNNNSTAQTLNINTSGIYWVDVTQNSCTTRDSITVGFGNSPTINLFGDSVLCQGTSTVLSTSTSGGSLPYSYSWNVPGSGSAITHTPALSGNVIVTVTDSSGCTDSDTSFITVNPFPTVNLGNDTIYCTISSIVLDAGNVGASYSWNDNSTNQTLPVNTSGIYWVDVTRNACTTRDSISLVIGNQPNINLFGDSTVCQGLSTVLSTSTSGGLLPYSYSWSVPGSGSSITYTPTGTATVQVTVTDGSGCTDTDSSLITLNPFPVVNLGSDTIYCNNPGITLNAGNPGAAYVWSDNSTSSTLTVNTTAIYWVDVTVNECTTRDSINLVFGTLPTVSVNGDFDICIGESTTLTASATGGSAPYGYVWSTNQTTAAITASPTVQTVYTVVATDASGCSDTTLAQVNVNPYPIVSLGNDTVVCGVPPYTLNAGNPGASFIWSTASVGQTLAVSQNGIYWVDVNLNGCVTRDSVNVAFDTLPTVNLGADVIVCGNLTKQLNAGNTGATFLWNTGATTQQITVSTPGIYWVTATKCGASSTDTVQVIGGFSPEDIYIPNAFTPNSDGLNDVFKVYFNFENIPIEIFDMKIYDRWGQVVKTFDTAYDAWDGTYNGTDIAAQQVFAWRLRFYDTCIGEEVNRTGFVVLLR